MKHQSPFAPGRAALIALAAIIAGPATSAYAQLGGYYRLTPRHSGKAVVVSGASTADNAAVVQGPYTSAAPANDEWSFTSLGGGYYSVAARHSGKVMAVSGASTASSAPVIQVPYGGAATNDEWAVQDLGTGYYRFLNRNSGKVLDVKQGSTADGAVLQQSTWSGVNQQQFQLVSVGGTPTATPTPTPTTPTPTPTPSPTPTPINGWRLRWTGDPSRGLATFEGVEDDRRDSHTSYGPHIRTVGSLFQFDMHMVDRDGSDRQRHEIKGLNVPGEGDIIIRQGETWLFVYDMYIPSSLTGGSRFTHIYQQKMVSDAGSSGGPLITLSTASGNTLLPRVISGFSSIPLSSVWNRWVTVEFEHKFDFSSNGGYARWAVKSGGSTLTDQRRTGNMFANEGTRDRRVRPKWGIYRSLGSSGLRDCYLQLRNMKAYQR